MVHHLSEKHSLMSNWIAELRDVNVQNDRMRFRRNLERIGEVAAYEMSKLMPSKIQATKTPLGIHESKVLEEQPVLATILRAGLPLHQGMLNYFDKADNAFKHFAAVLGFGGEAFKNANAYLKSSDKAMAGKAARPRGWSWIAVLQAAAP